ncbi:hypothetical protein SAMN05421823_110181 [Catalinimonas alkaloidigena]|uniref:Glycosyl hydrolases family 43 n=1 Tax=Catalinimonas alkaloidigena TaxID=1075417 RepID=A0A1G9QI83_9BACT|nr:hypothetical protein [Catalinimonas alkaloidigena]SDM10686.1 hypothetical protein SAMN05421823_110181 [Catalinimonas alkaloidigena]
MNFHHLPLSSFQKLIPLCCALFVAQGAFAQTDSTAWESATFDLKTKGAMPFTTADLGHPFVGEKNCIVRIAPEIDGLTGIRLQDAQPVKVRFREAAQALIGVPQGEPAVNGKKILTRGLTVTGLPPVDVYAVPYAKGTHTIDLDGKQMFLGAVKASETLTPRDAHRLDGREWDTYIVEGFSDEKALFEIMGGPDEPVIDEGMPGTEGIQGGFEGGRCVKIGDTYHMFPTERAGQKGIEPYYDRVKTKIGYWTSKDAKTWTRQSAIYEASGTYAVTEDDNPINDRRGAIWSYMPVFSETHNRWYGFYLAYTVHFEIAPNHSFGRIWRTESTQEGEEGIAGPYQDQGIVMEPGLDSQPWEGRQGVDSFFPYQVGDKWLAFYGGAYPFASWDDYPKNTGKGWYVGLAEADSLEGPWTRLDTTVNPVTSMHPWFIENPIVSQLPNDLYIAIFDGGPDAWGHHLPNMMGYSLSKDGYHWTEAHYFPIRTKVKKWWDIMRTPLCLIPEDDGTYTMVYAAIDAKKRFHPMGMVKLKLNQDVLAEKLQELTNAEAALEAK